MINNYTNTLIIFMTIYIYVRNLITSLESVQNSVSKKSAEEKKYCGKRGFMEKRTLFYLIKF